MKEQQLEGLVTPFGVIDSRTGQKFTVTGFSGDRTIIPPPFGYGVKPLPVAYLSNGGAILVAELLRHFRLEGFPTRLRVKYRGKTIEAFWMTQPGEDRENEMIDYITRCIDERYANND